MVTLPQPTDTPKQRIRLEGDDYTLSTGRRFYANQGIVGMSPAFAAEGNRFANGYDSDDYTRKAYPEHEFDEWTPAERQELAAYISALWFAWAAHSPTPAPTDAEKAAESSARLETANRALLSAQRR